MGQWFKDMKIKTQFQLHLILEFQLTWSLPSDREHTLRGTDLSFVKLFIMTYCENIRYLCYVYCSITTNDLLSRVCLTCIFKKRVNSGELTAI